MEDVDADIASFNIDRVMRRISILEGESGTIRRLKVVYYTSDFERVSKNDDDEGEWRTHEIPVGQYVIGFRCNTDAVFGKISRLDFLLGGTPWTGFIDGFIEFGGQGEYSGEHEDSWDSLTYPWTDEYPSPGELAQLPLYSDWTLSEIRYKQYANKYGLEGLQLGFANGEETPWL